MKSHREQIKVDGSPMNLYISQPDGDGPFPAVVLIQHQNGVDKFMEGMTERIAAAGYFGVTPDLYHRDGPDCKDDGPTRRNRLRGMTVIKDVNATVDYLKGNRLVNAGQNRNRRLLFGRPGGLSDGGSESELQRRGHLLWRKHLQAMGRRPHAFRSDGGDHLPDPGPLRRAG